MKNSLIKTKTKQLKFSATPEEEAELMAQAGQLGWNLSRTIHFRVFQKSRRDKGEAKLSIVDFSRILKTYDTNARSLQAVAERGEGDAAVEMAMRFLREQQAYVVKIMDAVGLDGDTVNAAKKTYAEMKASNGNAIDEEFYKLYHMQEITIMGTLTANARKFQSKNGDDWMRLDVKSDYLTADGKQAVPYVIYTRANGFFPQLNEGAAVFAEGQFLPSKMQENDTTITKLVVTAKNIRPMAAVVGFQSISILGNLTENARSYVGKDGKEWMEFQMAVNWVDKKVEHTTYYTVVASKSNAFSHLIKGRGVFVKGDLQPIFPADTSADPKYKVMSQVLRLTSVSK